MRLSDLHISNVSWKTAMVEICVNDQQFKPTGFFGWAGGGGGGVVLFFPPGRGPKPNSVKNDRVEIKFDRHHPRLNG